jgi:hypothetical protein
VLRLGKEEGIRDLIHRDSEPNSKYATPIGISFKALYEEIPSLSLPFFPLPSIYRIPDFLSEKYKLRTVAKLV